MGKINNLSSDLNLIKELEELKLKQKILINSLNRKNKDELENYLTDLSQKIDFLVGIFKDANSSEKNEEETNVDKKFTDLNEKIDLIKEDFSKNFEEIQSSINSLNENLSNLSSQIIDLNKKNTSLNNSIQDAPPTPNFSGEQIEKLKEKPKKKWF